MLFRSYFEIVTLFVIAALFALPIAGSAGFIAVAIALCGIAWVFGALGGASKGGGASGTGSSHGD